MFAQAANIDEMLPKIAAEKNDSARAVMIWNCLGTSETDPVYDMHLAEKLLVQAQDNNDRLAEIFALSCLGYDYRAFGDNTKSIRYNLQAFALAEKYPNEQAKCIANTALALNYEDMGNYTQALKLFHAGRMYGTRSNFGPMLAICYMSMGELYLNTGKIDSALYYTQRAYELSIQIHYNGYLGPMLQQLGTIHARLGNAGLAESYFELSVTEGYKANSPKFISIAYTALAQYFYAAHKPDSAATCARNAIAVVQHTPFINMGIDPAKLLLDIYRGKNVDSAFKYSEIYRIANDSLFNTKTVQETQLLAFEENVRQQQLAEEKVKADEERRRNIQYALIALGIITFIIIFLLLSRKFITNTRIIEFLGVMALLIVFEFLNLLLHPVLARITHETPLLMLLGLVAIAAILVPLHHRLEHMATHKLVEKNKQLRLNAAKKTIEKLEGKEK